MKKLVSLILVLCMVLSLSVTAFAKAECTCDHSPVIYIPGFGAPIFENTEEGPVRIYEPTDTAFKKAAPTLVGAVIALLCTRYKLFATLAMKSMDILLGKVSCDNEGNPIYDTSIPAQALPTADVHGQYRERFGDYQFNYDWRLDPVDTARRLHTWVERVLEITGHDQVSLTCFSMGNTVVASYLYLYGSEQIDKIAFMSPAYQGISILGSLLSGEADIKNKSDELSMYVDCMLEDMNMNPAVKTAAHLAGRFGAYKPVLRLLQGALNSQFERVYYECLRGMFGQMPGIWAFVPDEYYESAKAFTLRGEAQYENFEKKIDFYHNNVQKNLLPILEDARMDGVEIIFACGYGMSTIPLSKAHTAQSDMLIDTRYMSLGATCAPYGSTLTGEQKVKDGDNHISPEKTIDASTCAYPEFTWFIRDQLHFEQGDELALFIRWALGVEGQPTVSDNPQYPQFMIADNDRHLHPNTITE